MLSSTQTKLATGLISKGYELKDYENRHVIKLTKGKKTIYLLPKK